MAAGQPRWRDFGCLSFLLCAVSVSGGLPGRPAAARLQPALDTRLATFAITRRVCLAHTAASALLLLPGAAPAATTPDGVQVFKVASAALDRRAYRGLILANGMRVLVASDPAAGKAAAAMNVQADTTASSRGAPAHAHPIPSFSPSKHTYASHADSLGPPRTGRWAR